MTEGVILLIILLWVPPRPPSSNFSAALPKPCRRGKAHKRGCLWPDCLQLVRIRIIIGFSSGPAWKNILHCWVGWGRNFWPLGQIPTRNLQGSALTVTHSPQAVRTPVTQKSYGAAALDRTVRLLKPCFVSLEHVKFSWVFVLKRQVPIHGKLSQ